MAAAAPSQEGGEGEGERERGVSGETWRVAALRANRERAASPLLSALLSSPDESPRSPGRSLRRRGTAVASTPTLDSTRHERGSSGSGRIRGCSRRRVVWPRCSLCSLSIACLSTLSHRAIAATQHHGAELASAAGLRARLCLRARRCWIVLRCSLLSLSCSQQRRSRSCTIASSRQKTCKTSQERGYSSGGGFELVCCSCACAQSCLSDALATQRRCQNRHSNHIAAFPRHFSALTCCSALLAVVVGVLRLSGASARPVLSSRCNRNRSRKRDSFPQSCAALLTCCLCCGLH